jgi:glycogen operon protein
MICHGDELGRTQRGNNNGYCQDNELTWIDWTQVDVDLLAFTREVATLRREHPVFRRRRFFDGRPVRRRGGLPDIAWFRPDSSEMTEEDWGSGFGRSVAMFINGQGIPDRDQRGQRVVDDSFFLAFSAHDEALDFTLPPEEYGQAWEVVIDTLHGVDDDAPTVVTAGAAVTIGPRAIVVLRRAD